jgi:hypothetical protein
MPLDAWLRYYDAGFSAGWRYGGCCCLAMRRSASSGCHEARWRMLALLLLSDGALLLLLRLRLLAAMLITLMPCLRHCWRACHAYEKICWRCRRLRRYAA